MDWKLFKCRICWNSFLGSVSSNNCPFCGAAYDHLVLVRDWVSPEVNLSQESAADLVKTLEMSVEDGEFYLCASGLEEKGSYARELFKVFAFHNKFRTLVLKKALELESAPEPSSPGFCRTRLEENVKDSKLRQSRARKFFLDSVERAEGWVKEFFVASSEVEAAHLRMLEELEPK